MFKKQACDNIEAGIAGNYLQAVMDTVLDGLVIINEIGNIQSLNQAAEKIFGYDSPEIIGKKVNILMPEPYYNEHDSYISHYLETGEKKVIGIGREASGKRKDGSIFPIELGVNELVLDGSRMFVGTIRDVSERKKAEQKILQYMAAITRSNQELDDFAHIASHDLKEPLRGLSNNAAFLKEDYEELLGEEGGRRLSRMNYLCERMERLINDLLNFSRIGRQELAIQETDIKAVVKDVISILENSLQESNAKVRIVSDLPVITCDLPRITEVFLNLVANAIKYNEAEEKLIEIGCENISGKGPVFYVRDNGIGIEKEFHDEVFRIFRRLNNEDETKKGTGAGLTFVKKIIERHNGKIWVDSTLGKGTVFYFTINIPAIKG